MKWNYNVDKAPLNIRLLCYCDSGLKLLIRQREKYGLLRYGDDKKNRNIVKALENILTEPAEHISRIFGYSLSCLILKKFLLLL